MTYDAPLFRVALAVPHGVPFLERLQVGVAQHARAAGWTAQVLEQLEDNRLYRPLTEYVGPEPGKTFVPIAER